MSYSWSYAPTDRATCKGKCKEKIPKGSVRFATASDDGHHEMISYRCLACVTDLQIKNITAKVGGLDKVSGFDELKAVDQSAVLAKTLAGGSAAAAKASPKGKAKATPAPKPKPAPAPAAKATASGGTKRKATPSDKDQHSFLDQAKNRDFEAVKASVLACPELINMQPAGRWAALHQFAQAGMAESVKWLLSNGASRNVKTSDGKTPLDVATDSCKAILSGRGGPSLKKDDPMEEDEAEAEEEDEAEDEDEDEDEAEEEAPVAAAPSSSSGPPAKKAKTGHGRPVDSAVPGRENYSVVDDWSVLLNQTNVGENKNKFYKIQVLQASGKHFCWTHWGRVGFSGQNKLEPCGAFASAEEQFRKKFREKSGVAYASASTHDWTPTIGKYTLVETDEAEGGEAGDSAPLGKLSPQQIEKGQAVLKKLEAVFRDSSSAPMKKLMDLSGEYYTLIPHDFGFKAMSEFTINSKEMLEREEELLKFFMRMGFEEMDKADDGLTPVSGIMAMELPKSLEDACAKICAMKDIKASMAKGTQHAEKQSGKPSQSMTSHLYGAIMLYTSNAVYRELNNVLRSEDRGKIKKYFAYLRLLLEALRRLPQQNKTVWRGVGVDLYEQYKKGSEVTWWGASSCTADINVAKNFMKSCGGKCTLLTIQSKTAADISAITFFGNEKENLLAPGTKLKVLSAERDGNTTKITMVETGRVLD